MAVDVLIKLTQKQAGRLYMAHDKLKAEHNTLRKAVCLVCVEELLTSENFESDNDCIEKFLDYTKKFE